MAAAETRHVVVLYGERSDLPGLAAIDADLAGTLRAATTDDIQVYRESMDLSRFAGGNYPALLRDFLRNKYADKRIDVAVAVMGPALNFLLNYGEVVFPGAQIVFGGIDRRELDERPVPPHVHGVLVKRRFADTLDIALSVHPGTRRVVVVAGTSGLDTRIVEQARQEFRGYEDRLAFTYLTELTLPELLKELSRLPAGSLVLFSAYFQDGAGAPFVPHEVVSRVSAAASVPTYGALDLYLGRGIVGGSLFSMSEHGSAVAKTILDVLAGKPPVEPFSEPQASKLLFDWRQMQRWGIAPWQLPAGSKILHREFSLWESYRWQIELVTAAVLFQAALIVWLLYEHRRRHVAETMVRNTRSELAYLNRRAGAGELSASIAHEVNQPLAAIVNWAAAARRWLSAQPPDMAAAREALAEIDASGRRAGDIIHNLRALFRRDAPAKAAVDINAIVRTVLGLTTHELGKHGVEVTTRLADDLPAVNGVGIQLQQVVLNLVLNAIDAMASAGAPRQLRIVSETAEPGKVRLSIADSGAGIRPSDLDQIFEPMFTTKPRGMGMGLSISRSIIDSHDGRIRATNGPSRGATFHIELPAVVAARPPDLLRYGTPPRVEAS